MIRAPLVIGTARAHGLVLGANGWLYDTKSGESLPEGVNPMRLLTESERAAFPEPATATVIPGTLVRNPGDRMAAPPGPPHDVSPAMTGRARLYRMRVTDEAAGPARTAEFAA